MNRQDARDTKRRDTESDRPGVVAVSFCLFVLLFTGSAAQAQLQATTTEHYRIHTDLDARLADDLSRRMEAMYAQYSLRLADFGPHEKTRFKIFLFAKKADYLTLTGNAVPNTGGVFIPSRSVLAAYLENQ